MPSKVSTKSDEDQRSQAWLRTLAHAVQRERYVPLMRQGYTIAAAAILVALFSTPAFAADDNPWIEVEGGSWVPSPEVLATLKSGIRRYVEAQARKERRELKKWSDYTFQYQGQQQNSHKFVFVGGFCTNSGLVKDVQLSKRMVLVEDGGTCFFDLKYDPGEKRFYSLYINGEA